MGNISGWTEGIILSIAFVVVLSIVIAGYNLNYNKDYTLPISDNQTESLFIRYQETSQSQIEGGEVQFDANQGISLKQSYGLSKDAINIVWSFISGGWIERTAELWNVGESGMALARALRTLYFLSLVFALLYALFKVVL